MANESAPSDDPCTATREHPDYAWRTLGLWSLIACVILVWWMALYTGWLEPLGEWQFARFGRFYPTLTILTVAALAIVPIGLVIRARHGHLRRRRRKAIASPGEAARLGVDHALRSGRRAERLFAAIGVCALVLALLAFIAPFLTPPAGGPVVGIEADSPEPLRAGPARLAGAYRLGPVGRFEERFLFIRHTVYVAPVFPVGGGDARLLTVVEPRLAGPGFRPISQGVIVPRGLPRELELLYRNAQVPLAERLALLMRDEAQRVWRYRTLAGEALAVALLAGLFLLAFRRHRRRLAERAAGVGKGDAR